MYTYMCLCPNICISGKPYIRHIPGRLALAASESAQSPAA